MLFVAVLGLLVACEARIHSLTLANDTRPFFVISSFGLLTGGSISIELSHVCFRDTLLVLRDSSFIQVSSLVRPRAMGFSVYKSTEASVNYNLESMV